MSLLPTLPLLTGRLSLYARVGPLSPGAHLPLFLTPHFSHRGSFCRGR